MGTERQQSLRPGSRAKKKKKRPARRGSPREATKGGGSVPTALQTPFLVHPTPASPPPPPRSLPRAVATRASCVGTCCVPCDGAVKRRPEASPDATHAIARQHTADALAAGKAGRDGEERRVMGGGRMAGVGGGGNYATQPGCGHGGGLVGSGSGQPPPRRSYLAIMSHRGRRSQPRRRVLCPHRPGDRKIFRARLTVRGAWRRRKTTADRGPRAYRQGARAARPTRLGPREGGTVPDAANGQVRDGRLRVVVVAATPRPRSRVTAAGSGGSTRSVHSPHPPVAASWLPTRR